MIRDNQIPDEVTETLAQRLYESFLRRSDARIPPWLNAPEQLKFIFRDEAQEMAAAMLNAWPGAWAVPIHSDPKFMLHLPLPQKEGDA